MSHPSGPPRARARRHVGEAGAIAVALLLVSSVAGPAAATLPGAPEDRPAEEPQAQQEVLRTPSGFTVRANNGSLPEILALIGGEAGFQVMDSGKNYPPVTVAIEDTPLDSLLHQLLRGANFFILYKGGSRGQSIDGRAIDRIVLLTSGGAGGATSAGAPPARAGRVSPLAGTKTGRPAGPAPVAPPPPGSQPDDAAAALAAAAAAANDAGGSEILRRLRAARAARSGGAEPGSDPNLDSVTAAAAAALAQHAGGQVDPSVLEAARLAAQRAFEANGGGGVGNQGAGNFGNPGFAPDPGPMDDAQYPDE